ncbi:Acetoin dehydrogenase E1 component beta-subunit [hydrothermal vent metagenome]|uniref:Acetoin dehydrogenase E1 component beta-subunit n=1 Tax=hydrothermal vent metagenome TaxID=652676 RepID=A0A3B0X0Q0_9ZZZZ
MNQEIFYYQALNHALDEEMAADDSVFILGEDVALAGGSYRVTEGLYVKYGEWRVRDTPISEGSFTGLGVGAALIETRPIVEIMTINFALLALDAIINMAAKIPFMSGGQFAMPLVVRMPGGIAKQLAAQHSQRLEHTLMNVPGLRIAVPATVQDAFWQLKQAIRSNEPIVLLEHELLYFSKGNIDEAAEPIPMHRAMVRCTGEDITIISYSRTAILAEQAATKLIEQGISAEVVDLRSLSPIDWQTCITSVQKTHNLLIVEEDCVFAGAGAEIAAKLAQVCFYELDSPVQRHGAMNIPTPYNRTLEIASAPTVESIFEAAEQVINGSK